MKRLFYVVTACAALSLAACGKEDAPSAPSAPIIEMEGLNIEEVHEITDRPMRVKVGVKAEGGIETFSVKIESPLLTDELLREIDLAAEMELTAPASDEMAAALKNLGFPVGGNVKGSTDQSFDISQFMPLIKQLYGGHEKDSRHDFVLTVKDAHGQSVTKSLKFHISAAPASISYNGDADLWLNTASFSVENQGGGEVAVEYRRAETTEWQKAEVTDEGDGIYKAIAAPAWVKGDAEGLFTLDARCGVFAGAKYEYRLLVDGEEVATAWFETSAGDAIPNGDMSVWSRYAGYSPDLSGSEADYPNASADDAFWSNGNNSMTKTLCMPFALSEDNKCALLKGANPFGLGIYAAGNLFAGVFEMSGFAGYARFGRKYEYTARPSAVKLRYKANVGKISLLGLKDGVLTTDDIDPATVFVCITDWTDRHSVHSGLGVNEDEINAFDPVAHASTAEGAVIAYGSVTVTESTDWVEVVIPLVYRDKESRPAAENYSLVISCASSKYGDYLCGNPDNELYVDDFEWVY